MRSSSIHSTGLPHHHKNPICRSSFDSGSYSHYCTSTTHVQDQHIYQITPLNAFKKSAPANSADPISNLHGPLQSTKKADLVSLDRIVPSKQRTFDGTMAAAPTASMQTIAGPVNNFDLNCGVTSKQTYANGRSFSASGHTKSPALRSMSIMTQEKASIQKIGTTAPYTRTKAHSDMIKKSGYCSHTCKNDLATVNDHTELHKLIISDGSETNLAPYRPHNFKVADAEDGSKRIQLSEQATFDTASDIPQPSFTDSMNRGYAPKSFIPPFSMKLGTVEHNSLAGFKQFLRFVNDGYTTVRTQTGHAKQMDFDFELSVAGIPRKTSPSKCDSQERIVVSGQEYMKRLLQAHQVVDELLKSRGLIPEDEIEYLRNWRQRTSRDPMIEERNPMDSSAPATLKNIGSFDASEASQQRYASNASDSGLSVDADSEYDPRGSPKLRGLNSQKFTPTKLSSTEKQEACLEQSVQVNVVKVKQSKNVCLKVIIRKPQKCWLYVESKLSLKKEESMKKKAKSNAARSQKKSCNEGQQIVGRKTEQIGTENLTDIPAKSSEKGVNQDHKLQVNTTREQSSLVRESSSAGDIKSGKSKKHNVSIVKRKYEAVNVCFCFVKKFCAPDKATIFLPTARYITIKHKGTAVSGQKFLQKTKNKSKLKCNNDGSKHVLSLSKAKKLSLNPELSAAFPESQTLKEESEIMSEESKMLENKRSTTEIEKDVLDLKTVGKWETPKKSPGSFSTPQTKKVALNEIYKNSGNKQQLCVVTTSKDLCQPRELLQLETAVTMPVRTHEIKISKLVVYKEYNCEMQKVNGSSLLEKTESIELKKAQKMSQNYTAAIPEHYQKTLRPAAINESNVITKLDCNADTEIRRAREHLRRINFSRTSGRLDSHTFFVQRINEDAVKSSDTNAVSLGTFSERNSLTSSVLKKKGKKKVSGMKVEKGLRDRPPGICSKSTEKGLRDGRIAERNSDILDKELVNEYRRSRRIPKPQAKIPTWNVFDERRQVAVPMRNPSKLRHGTLSTVSPAPCFIRARTPAPIDVTVTLSKPTFATTALLRHVPTNPLPTVTSWPKKNILSSGSNVPAAGSLQQQSPSDRFGVMLKRVDRAAIQKSKLCGAITQSAPKKPWVPKWRRIQRTEEEGEAETIATGELNKHENEGGDDEYEEKQMPKRLSSRRSSQIIAEKDMTEAEKAMMEAKRRQVEEETAKLHEYEEKRRVEREREEEELRKLKEKKERRKLERKEEEKQFQERLKQEEERRKQEEEERKAKLEAERRRKEDDKRKRQQMLSSQFTKTMSGMTGRNFIIPQKSDKADKFGNIVQAKQEMSMTKEQQEEAKRNYLISVMQTIELENVSSTELREKIRQLHQRICKLEADKYDLEKRHERQEYDLRELNERQRQVARNKALKKGLDPADTNSRHPPKVSIVSKYDRQIDRRNFKERRAMFENKNAYPCFPNVPPPPTVCEKVVFSGDKENDPEDEDDEVCEQEEEGDGKEEEEEED